MEADIEEDDVGRPVGNVQDAREGFISLDKRLTRFVGNVNHRLLQNLTTLRERRAGKGV